MSRQDVEPCRLGSEEHDGSRYCFEHYGFAHYLMRRSLVCDRAPHKPYEGNN